MIHPPEHGRWRRVGSVPPAARLTSGSLPSALALQGDKTTEPDHAVKFAFRILDRDRQVQPMPGTGVNAVASIGSTSAVPADEASACSMDGTASGPPWGRGILPAVTNRR